MTKPYRADASGVRWLCVGCMVLILTFSQVVLSQSSGLVSPSSEGVGQLSGKVGSQRASLIAQIAPSLRAGLSAQEAADILGTSAELSEGSRANAIQSIARAKKLGTLGAEAALMLRATTGSHRSFAISEITPYLKLGLTAQEAADILGTSAELSEGSRANAIQSIARGGKVRAGLSEVELAPVLHGTTGSARAFALAELLAAKPIGALAWATQPTISVGPQGTAGSTPSVMPGTSVTSLPTISSTDGSVPPNNPMTGRVRIVASVLGETATEGGTIKPQVPLGVGIEVSFRTFIGEDTTELSLSGLSQPLATSVKQDHRYVWSVDGKPRSEGERFVQWFGAGAYTVEVRAEPIALTAGSTPQVTRAAPHGLRAWVRVEIVEDKQWDCWGRLGAKCGDRRRSKLTSDVKVEPGCESRANAICIHSKMSVGAIKHDYCCLRFPKGHMCEGITREFLTQLRSAIEIDFDVLPGKTICETEFEQAEADRVTENWWSYVWEYPPNSESTSYRVTSHEAGWHKKLAPAGVKVKGALDGVFCSSGSVEKRIWAPNPAMAGNPNLVPKVETSVWVCKK